MLHEFLEQYRSEITQLCRAKVLADAENKPTSELLDKGLPIFYDELIGVLRRTATTNDNKQTSIESTTIENTIKEGDAATHGKESLRLGYTISQVVHSYGAVCQSITEYVQTKSYAITTREFQDLNLSLDCAIAEAVTEFEKAQSEKVSEHEVERLGFLMHEMRNSLSAADAAHQMIQKGSVGNAGITSDVLSRSHQRMRHLIESAEAEIRFRGHIKLEPTQIRLIDIISEINANSMIIGEPRNVRAKLDIDPTIQLTADRPLVFSAMSNLMSNAMKFTKDRGTVSVRAKRSGGARPD